MTRFTAPAGFLLRPSGGDSSDSAATGFPWMPPLADGKARHVLVPRSRSDYFFAFFAAGFFFAAAFFAAGFLAAAFLAAGFFAAAFFAAGFFALVPAISCLPLLRGMGIHHGFHASLIAHFKPVCVEIFGNHARRDHASRRRRARFVRSGFVSTITSSTSRARSPRARTLVAHHRIAIRGAPRTRAAHPDRAHALERKTDVFPAGEQLFSLRSDLDEVHTRRCTPAHETMDRHRAQ